MKSLRRSSFLKVFVLAIGVLAATASSAHAQAANGTFTLTHDARWGGVLLPAGNYAFSLQSRTFPAQITVSRAGGAQLAIVLPQMLSNLETTEPSRLVLSRNQTGESFVTALYLGDIGLGLHYGPPKSQTPAPETAKLAPMADSQSGK